MRILIVCLFLTQCVYNDHGITIIPLDPYSKIDSFENSNGKILQCSKFYLIEHFKDDDTTQFKQLEDFAFSN